MNKLSVTNILKLVRFEIFCRKSDASNAVIADFVYGHVHGHEILLKSFYQIM